MFFGDHWISSSVVFWGAIVLIVIVTSISGHFSRAARYKMIEKLAEKGQTISPELLHSVSIGIGNGRGLGHRSPIQSGIFLMCIGIALAVFFWAMNGGGGMFGTPSGPYWLPVIGIFPFMLGLARLLGGLTDRRPPK